ncbi:hypothetical protein EG835_10095 [bacterium]|nr:hypothetical protein [bacterium]
MAIGVYGIGNIAWAYLEYSNGPVPYPGLPDYFYITSYLLLALALGSAAYAYRDIVDIRPGAGIAATAGVVLAGISYVGLLEPYVLSSPTVSPAEKALSLFYPIADILLLIVPGVALVMVLRRLSAPELAWPWGFVVAGTVLLAVSDTSFAILAANETYATGGLVDYGWMACHVAFAVGASFEADAAGYRSRRQRMHANGLRTTHPTASP